jgi:hypothetical protein
MAKKIIYSVKAATAIAISKNLIFISAVGETRTSGWKDPQLDPFIYVQPPPDGIQDFNFVATPPSGVSLPVLTPIATFKAWKNPPSWVKGVRIHAEINSKTTKLIKLSASLQAKAPKKAAAKSAAKKKPAAKKTGKNK